MGVINIDEIDGAAAVIAIIEGRDYTVEGTDTGLPNVTTTTGQVVEQIYTDLAALTPPITPGSVCPNTPAGSNFLQKVVPYKCVAAGSWKFKLIYKGYPATQVDLGTTLQEVDSNTDINGAPIVVEYNYPSAFREQHPEIPPGITLQGGVIPKKNQETTTSFKFTQTGGGAGTGASGTAAVNDGVTQVILVDGGTGWSGSSTLNVNSGSSGGSGAMVSAITTNGNFLANIAVTHSGSNYSSNPKITISSGGGPGGASATATVVDGVITAIQVTNGGNGFTTTPTILIGDATGTGATAVGQIAYAITGLAITNAGSGYTAGSLLEITISGSSSGSGFIAYAYVGTGIKSISVSGSGYTKGAFAFITDSGSGTGTGATCLLSMSGGTITGVTLLSPGYGYTSPVVTIIGGAGTTTSGIILAFAMTFVGMVNKGVWGSAPGAARTWLCSSVRGISRDGGVTYEVTVTFTYRASSWDFLVLFNDPYTGKPPANLIPGLGYKTVQGYVVGTLPVMPPA